MSPLPPLAARLVPAPDPWRDRVAWCALAPLVCAMLALLPALPWYSNFDVDSMTWFEQVRAVATTGSLGFDNGPAPQTNTETCTLWFVAAGGRIWGIYPAPLTYVLAPAMWLGGFRGVIRALWLFELLAALVTYATVYRLTRRRGLAVGAAYALVTGTSWLVWASTIGPFVPGGALLVLAVYARTRAQQRALDGAARVALAWALAAGACASLALGSHVIAVLAWALVGATTLVAPGSVRVRGAHLAAFALGSAPAIALMVVVNHARFGTYSPLSYGPCNAQNCTGALGQDAALYAALGRVVALYGTGAAVLLWFARRSPRALVVVTLFAAAIATVPDLPEPWALRPVVRALYGYVIDLGGLEIENFARARDGVGNVHNGWCVRALLQCTPAFAAALLARPRRGGGGEPRGSFSARRVAHLAAAGACVGVLLVGALRAREWSSAVWGNPFLNVRYLTLIAPCATVLAALAVERLPLGAAHVAVWALTGAAGAVWLSAGRDGPGDPLRRALTHVLPVLLALALVALLGASAGATGARDGVTRGEPVPWRLARGWAAHLASLVVALCLGYGTAVTLGIDATVVLTLRRAQDAETAELLAIPERRFMLLGGHALDHALAIHDARDVRIVNLGLDPGTHPRSAAHVRAWLREGGAAYVVQDGSGATWQLAWPGVRAVRLAGTTRVLRLELAPTP